MSQMPEYVVGKAHCGTQAPGWLNGNHPTSFGYIVEMKVCFNFVLNTCSWQTDIFIIKCGYGSSYFYLYYLSDTPICYSRYCTE